MYETEERSGDSAFRTRINRNMIECLGEEGRREMGMSNMTPKLTDEIIGGCL